MGAGQGWGVGRCFLIPSEPEFWFSWVSGSQGGGRALTPKLKSLVEEPPAFLVQGELRVNWKLTHMYFCAEGVPRDCKEKIHCNHCCDQRKGKTTSKNWTVSQLSRGSAQEIPPNPLGCEFNLGSVISMGMKCQFSLEEPAFVKIQRIPPKKKCPGKWAIHSRKSN